MAEPVRSEPLFRGAWVRVDLEEWPGVGAWEVIRPKDAACVLPLTPDGDVVLVRQFRAAARRDILEAPAGLLDVDGEEPIACAARELFEETGFRHASIEPLARVFPSPGLSTEAIHLFLARTSAEPERSPEHGIELVRRPFADMVARARDGGLDDAKTTLALLMAAARTTAG
jgi:ADP-ribose pyrophosphatase